MKPMSEELTYAYSAGLMDGEGTVALIYKYKTSRYRWPHVALPSCTSELTAFLKEQFGGCVSGKKARKKNHSPSATWAVTGDRALSFLQKVLPYLREPEKIRRAQMLVKDYKKLTPRNGRYTEEQRQAKLTFEHRFFEEGRASRQTANIRWAA